MTNEKIIRIFMWLFRGITLVVFNYLVLIVVAPMISLPHVPTFPGVRVVVLKAIPWMLGASLIWGLLVWRLSRIPEIIFLASIYIAGGLLFKLPDPAPKIRYTTKMLETPPEVEKSYDQLMKHKKGSYSNDLKALLPDQLWMKADKWDILSDPEKKKIDQAWVKAKEVHSYLKDLDRFPGITDWTPKVPFRNDIPLPDFRYLRSATLLYALHAQSLAQSGQTTEALHELAMLYSVTLKGMEYSNTLLCNMIFFMMNKITVKTTYHIVQNASPKETDLHFIQQHFPPLNKSQTSMRRIALTELLMFEEIIKETKEEIITTREKTFVGRQTTANELKKVDENRFITETQECLDLLLKKIDNDPNGVLRDVHFPHLEESGIALSMLYPRDLIGHLIYAIATPNYAAASKNILTTKVYTDLLSLTVSKKRSPALLDPWNQKPYLFDTKKNRFFSVGPDLKPHTSDDIYL